MKDITFTDQFPIKRDRPIDLLIGEPYYSHLMIGGPILGKFGQPGAQKTLLGNALCASNPKSVQQNRTYAIRHDERTSLHDIEEIMKKFWSLWIFQNFLMMNLTPQISSQMDVYSSQLS